MTLLELLRQELPKRGGWPEGAAKATSYSYIPGVHFWDVDGFRVDFSDLTTRELGYGEVTREQYEAAAAAWWRKDGSYGDIIAYRLHQPQQAEQPEVSEEDLNECIGQAPSAAWTEEGLPPVGCECEHRAHSGVVTVVQIIAHFKNRAAMVAAYIPVKGDVKQVQQSVAGCFRPLRTEAERTIDEMVQLSGVSIGAAKILYNAGYRKG